MTQPTGEPRVIWQGNIEQNVYRVVDRGPAAAERLVVEIQAPADAMNGRGWNRFDSIPRIVFERMLVQSGVVT
jgi:hypothetical protein